jgi:hypothetical protein
MMAREQLPNRRGNTSIGFEFDGFSYRATAGRFSNRGLAEIFLDLPGKLGTPIQSNADNAAILVSLALQHGVDPEVIRRSVTGPVAIALSKFLEGK